MNKTIKEKPETKPVAKPPQSKRHEEAFKKQAVENWLQSGRPGTQIARELPDVQAMEAMLMRRCDAGACG